MDAPLYWGLFGLKSGLSEPSGKYRHSSKANGPKPLFEIRFKCTLGMIWSVSILSLKRGTILPLYVVIGLIAAI